MQRKTKNDGAIAQLVEQRTENPCVPGSIPGGTTSTKVKSLIHTELAIFLLVTIAHSHYISHYVLDRQSFAGSNVVCPASSACRFGSAERKSLLRHHTQN